jgi:hypothetical protein
MAVCHRRFGKTYRSHLQESRSDPEECRHHSMALPKRVATCKYKKDVLGWDISHTIVTYVQEQHDAQAFNTNDRQNSNRLRRSNYFFSTTRVSTGGGGLPFALTLAGSWLAIMLVRFLVEQHLKKPCHCLIRQENWAILCSEHFVGTQTVHHTLKFHSSIVECFMSFLRTE